MVMVKPDIRKARTSWRVKAAHPGSGSAPFRSDGEAAKTWRGHHRRSSPGRWRHARHRQAHSRMWNAAQPMIEFAPAIKALEPN